MVRWIGKPIALHHEAVFRSHHFTAADAWAFHTPIRCPPQFIQVAAVLAKLSSNPPNQTLQTTAASLLAWERFQRGQGVLDFHGGGV
jgi:hypothetical protein